MNQLYLSFIQRNSELFIFTLKPLLLIESKLQIKKNTIIRIIEIKIAFT